MPTLKQAGRLDDKYLIRDQARFLRREQTEAEKKLWAALRARQAQVKGVKFRRQYPIGPYIADFCCIERGLIIELDGCQHGESEGIAKDEARSEFLQARGFRVIRFWNHEILTEPDVVLERIWDLL